MLLCIPFTLHSQEFQLNSPGVRARSLAGSYISIADDATAAFWNPAGLSQGKYQELYFSGTAEKFFLTSNIKDYNTDPWKYSHWACDFMAFKFIFPFFNDQKRIIAAISVQNMLDFYNEYEEDEYFISQSKGVNAISLSFGYAISNNWHIGLSLRHFNGKRKLIFNAKSDSLLGGDAEEDSLYSGYSIFPPDISILYNNASFRLGGIIRFPFKLKERNDEYNYGAEIKMPCMLGLGVAYFFSTNLFLSIDMEWQNSTHLDRKYLQKSEEYPQDHREQIGMNDVFTVRSGTELTTKFWNLTVPIRMGIAWMPKYYKGMDNEPIVGSLITAGIGIKYKNFSLDFGVEYNSYLYKFEGLGTYRENYLRCMSAFVISWGE